MVSEAERLCLKLCDGERGRLAVCHGERGRTAESNHPLGIPDRQEHHRLFGPRASGRLPTDALTEILRLRPAPSLSMTAIWNQNCVISLMEPVHRNVSADLSRSLAAPLLRLNQCANIASTPTSSAATAEPSTPVSPTTSSASMATQEWNLR